MKTRSGRNWLGIIALPVFLSPVAVQASGFAVVEQSASGLGNAFAGGSALADEASTVYFNPAGMGRMTKKQIQVAAHYIKPTIEYTDDGSTLAGVLPITGNDGEDAGVPAWIPNLYYVHPIDDRLRVGLSVNVPFGLSSEYDPEWVGRYHGIKSAIQTMNINPAVSYQVNNDLSLGFGVSYQTMSAQLTSAVDNVAVCSGISQQNPAAVPFLNCSGITTRDGHADIDGSSAGWGYNLGFIYNLSKHDRLGMAYRSAVDHTLEGDAAFTDIHPNIQAVAEYFVDGTTSADITLPATLSVSLVHEYGDTLAVMLDVTWTQWSAIETLAIDVEDRQTIKEELHWQDTRRYAIGAIYNLDAAMSLRAGVAYDESPVPDAEHRLVRVPDSDRTWLTLGMDYRFDEALSLSIGYAHISIKDADIDNTNATGHNLKGSFQSDVSIMSAQLNWRF